VYIPYPPRESVSLRERISRRMRAAVQGESIRSLLLSPTFPLVLSPGPSHFVPLTLIEFISKALVSSLLPRSTGTHAASASSIGLIERVRSEVVTRRSAPAGRSNYRSNYRYISDRGRAQVEASFLSWCSIQRGETQRRSDRARSATLRLAARASNGSRMTDAK